MATIGARLAASTPSSTSASAPAPATVLGVLSDALTPPSMSLVQRAVDESVTTPESLLALLQQDRPAFIRLIQRLGVAQLGERQRAANALAKALREARLEQQPCASLGIQAPPAAEVLQRALQMFREAAAAGNIRATALLQGCSRCDDDGALRAHLLATAPAASLIAALEGFGMVPAHAKLVPDAIAHATLHVAFWSNQLCERGTEVALFDYADFGERLLGFTSFVLYPASAKQNFGPTIDRFRARFGERLLPLEHTTANWPHQPEIDEVLSRHQISHVYVIKYGAPDGPEPAIFGRTGARVWVHAVFDAHQPNGDVFARISPCVPGRGAVVPHVVRPIEPSGNDLRESLGIPRDATVFGRHGGRDTFNVFEARHAVARVARERRDIFFLFMNTEPLSEVDEPNILYLEPTMDDARKAAFIRTCDAMLHARLSGETFGLAVAEFSVANRPVLASSVHTDNGAARFHLDTLGAKGLYYSDAESLVRQLLAFDRCEAQGRDWNAYRAFEPAKVMQTFKRVFICEGGSRVVSGRVAADG